ncbi:MAG: UDP-glucose 4-epimerase GalE [Pseudomonadales bacterium]|jgi:UDP-arabinose 4-epimerase|nr:UDP-glucose 4-epimerase GalE [Pseudomonadales bacterium]
MLAEARRVLVTGGAGYIGSHTAKLLKAAGIEPVVYDNLSTGHRASVRWGPFVYGDILDTARLCAALRQYQVEAVIHFAASAYVGESMEHPALYYRNNAAGAVSLLDACRLAEVDRVIFSSSCATYGVPAQLPIKESTPQQPINPYGRTKLMAEQMLQDYAAAYGSRYVALRYFNAAGCDPSGELGEWHDPETHLIPRALQAAAGKIASLSVYGSDYDTPDGTCIRDYIHVNDLAQAHLLALDYLAQGGANQAFNIGTGQPVSIRQIISVIERVTQRQVPIEWCARRPGDPPALYADASLARATLGFAPRYSNLDTLIRSAAPQCGLELFA